MFLKLSQSVQYQLHDVYWRCFLEMPRFCLQIACQTAYADIISCG